MRFQPGDEILVFYDGKLCRGSVGTVISVGRYGWATKKRHSQITVRFVPVDEDDSTPIVATFRPKTEHRNIVRAYDSLTRRGLYGTMLDWRDRFGLTWEKWYCGWSARGYYTACPRSAVAGWYWPENMLARKLKKEAESCSSANR